MVACGMAFMMLAVASIVALFLCALTWNSEKKLASA